MPSGTRTSRAEPAATAGDQTSDASATETWILFSVDDQTYALEMGEVDRIVRSVEVKPLPEVPPHIRGVVNVQGRVLPVVDLRRRFGHKSRAIALDGHFIIAQTPTLSLILPADSTVGLREVTGASVPEDSELPRCVRKVMPLDLGVVYALDLERVLFGDESPTDSELARVLGELQGK